MSAGDESGRHAHAGDAGARPVSMTDEVRADAPPVPERRASARPPAIAQARPPAAIPRPDAARPEGASASRDGAPARDDGAREPRQTTRMTTDEITALMGNGPPTADDFDAEKTIVIDERRLLDEHSSIDDSPTVEGEGKLRQLHEQARPVEIAPAPRPPTIDPPPEAQASEAGRRRTSRRTVRIPDDPVERQEKMVDRLNFADESAEEVTIVRPLRIIDIGSDPPPAIRSAEASWPPRALSLADSGEHAPTPVIPPARALSPAAMPPESVEEALLDPIEVEPFVPPPRTDPLPRTEAYDKGWTPGLPPVAPIEERPSGETELGQGDFEEVPDSPRPEGARTDGPRSEAQRPVTQPGTAPKKPPPPPKREPSRVQAKVDPEIEAQRAPTPVEGDMKSTAVDPGVIKKPRAWFEDLFGDDYLRTMDRLPASEVLREVNFVEESLSVEKHAVILDLACGRGEITCGLSSRGYSVVGVDLSPAALAQCQETARDARVKPSFLRADMRELDFEEAFDATVLWNTSFGYFDDAENVAVLRRIHRALRQGGMLLLDVANRDFVAPRSPSLVWFEGDGCVCMDDMSIDFLTSRMRVKRTAMFDDGHSRELEYSIRLYSLNELGRTLHEAGFKVVEVTGHLAHPGTFFGTESPRLIVLAERN